MSKFLQNLLFRLILTKMMEVCAIIFLNIQIGWGNQKSWAN